MDHTLPKLLLEAALAVLSAFSARPGLVGSQMVLSYLLGSMLVLSLKHRVWFLLVVQEKVQEGRNLVTNTRLRASSHETARLFPVGELGMISCVLWQSHLP